MKIKIAGGWVSNENTPILIQFTPGQLDLLKEMLEGGGNMFASFPDEWGREECEDYMRDQSPEDLELHFTPETLALLSVPASDKLN